MSRLVFSHRVGRLAPYTQSSVGTYTEEVLADKPALFLKLSDTSGTVAVDSSGFGRDGTYSGGPGRHRPLVADSGESRYLGGFNDSVYVPYTAALNTPQFHATIYVAPTPRPIHLSRLISNIESGELLGWELYLDYKNSRIVFKLADGTTVSRLDSGSLTIDGRMYRIDANYDGTTMRLYVDGVQKASVTATFSPATTVALRIGRRAYDTERYWKGRVHGVAVYDRALSATRIQTQFEAGKFPAPTTIPSSPTATTVRSTAVSLDFGLVAGASSYDIERDIAGSISSFNTGHDVNGYDDLAASVNTTHQYRVRARNAKGAGPWSGWISTTTIANKGGLIWADAFAAGGAVLNDWFYRNTGPKVAIDYANPITGIQTITTQTQADNLAGKYVLGRLDIDAGSGNIIIVRNVHVQGSSSGHIRVINGVSGTAVVEHCNLDSYGQHDYVVGSTEQVRYCRLEGAADGFKVAGGSTYEYNLVRDLYSTTRGGLHSDGAQSEGSSNSTIQFNYFDLPSYVHGVDTKSNACVIIKSDFSDIDSITVHKNFLNGGNNVTYFVAGKHPSTGVINNPPTNCRLTGNRFGRSFKGNLMQLKESMGGVVYTTTMADTSGNIWDDDGTTAI